MYDTRFVQERLANGLRVVIEVMPQVHSAACGFLARTGARDDPADLAGVAHFLEHMMFKGTARRTCQQINIEFDEIGAHYNAYTTNSSYISQRW